MKLTKAILVTLTVVSMIPVSLAAYPGYGKKVDASLGNSCQTCHVVFPKLKTYGKTVREIGYNVPGTDFPAPALLTKIYRAIPIALRGKVDFYGTDQESQVSVPALQLLSAGNMANDRITWWFHKHLVEENEVVPLNTGMPHESWVQYNQSDKLHVRVGMFELPMWFSWSKTKVSEFGYLYYGSSTTEGNFGVIAAPQFGIQANGTFNIASRDEDDWGEPDDSNQEGYNYAFSITNGQTSWARQINTVYARITKKAPGAALGLFSLAAVHTPAGADPADNGGTAIEGEYHLIYRLGIDGELNMRGETFSTYGSAAFGADATRNFTGGFVGVDYLLNQRLFIFSRLDGVLYSGEAPAAVDDMSGMDEDHADEMIHVHGGAISDDAASLSLGITYMIFGNLRLGGEYRYGVTGIDNLGMVQLQFAF